MKITVYTTTDCQFSKQEKEYLVSHNLQYEEKNLETNKEFLTEMMAVSNNFAGTPVTKIEKDDGTITVLKGFTKDEFDKALGFEEAVPQPIPTDSTGSNQPQPASTDSDSKLNAVMDKLEETQQTAPEPPASGSAAERTPPTTETTSASTPPPAEPVQTPSQPAEITTPPSTTQSSTPPANPDPNLPPIPDFSSDI